MAALSILSEAKITCITHPATYLNKFLIGFSNGAVELWNFNSKKMIHSFKSHTVFSSNSERDDELWHQSSHSVACIEQSPAVDTVAIGLSNGRIVVLNMKIDQVLFAFSQEGGEVTSMTFRTDITSEKYPYLVSASSDGRVHIWNLGTGGDSNSKKIEVSTRKLESTIEEAHSARVSRVAFLHGEPLFISAGADNSIKVWIFDAPDGTCRLLRSREGHSGTPLRIRYYGGTTNVSMRESADAESCEILSAGSDGKIRMFNTAVEMQNKELSQKPIIKKLGISRKNYRLPTCIGYDFSEVRQRDWGNLVTIHENHSNVYVWKYKHKTITEMVLKQSSWNSNPFKHNVEKGLHATAVALSACGNFCLVGYKGGNIYKYNLQSGLSRGRYPGVEKTKANAKKYNTPGNVYYEEQQFLGLDDSTNLELSKTIKGNDASERHVDEVTGLFTDMMNKVLVSCSLDGKVIFWNFSGQKVIRCVQTGTANTKLQAFRDANFAAVVGEDRVVRVYDTLTCKLSRRFYGHSREITDVAFTPDGRRLLTSSTDSTVRVWDMPTGRCLSWLSFSSPVLSMTVSLNGEFLCTSQADRQGLYLYIDRSLYETVHFWKEPTKPTFVADSNLSLGLNEEPLLEDSLQSETKPVVEKKQDDNYQSIDSEDRNMRGEGLIRTSNIPRAFWTSLFRLEQIKDRNKPKAPPEKPKAAPFFLPTVIKDSAPAFPSPAEYQKMLSTERVVEKATENWIEEDVKEMQSAWTDDDAVVTWGVDESSEKEEVPKTSTEKKSRLIRRKTQLPR